MRLQSCAIALSLAALFSAPASAIPVTYEFSGITGSVEPLGSYYRDFGIPFFTELSGQITIESDTAPYYEDASQKNFYDMLISATVQFGAGGAFGTYTGPSGLQVAPPYGWNSSSMSVYTGFYYDNTPYDAMAIYGSMAGQPGDAANNIYTRFSLWGVSTPDVFDAFPSLDQLPERQAWGPLPMGFDIVSAQFDAAGVWLGQTTQHANISSFQRVSASVPEPATWSLFGAGLLAMFGARRRQRAL